MRRIVTIADHVNALSEEQQALIAKEVAMVERADKELAQATAGLVTSGPVPDNPTPRQHELSKDFDSAEERYAEAIRILEDRMAELGFPYKVSSVEFEPE